MPKDIHQRDTAQQRSSRLLLAMGIIVLLGALAYFVLTLVVNRCTASCWRASRRPTLPLP